MQESMYRNLHSSLSSTQLSYTTYQHGPPQCALEVGQTTCGRLTLDLHTHKHAHTHTHTHGPARPLVCTLRPSRIRGLPLPDHPRWRAKPRRWTTARLL